MFDALAQRGEGAFVPFLVLGDPDPATSLALIRALVASGADALELGLPFSDPSADGPAIQAASTRALAAGTKIVDAWQIIGELRKEFAALPIGLLTYANLVVHGGVDRFYDRAGQAGADSALVVDVPLLEADPFAEAARTHGVAPVFIAPPNADDGRLAEIAERSEAYVYVTSRTGVTGADVRLESDGAGLIARLRRLGSAPPLLGFGISTPDHVRSALAMGAAGAISGSAVVQHIVEFEGRTAEILAAVSRFTRAMKAATYQVAGAGLESQASPAPSPCSPMMSK
jgi:tryptophan synthase alpha chain